MNHIHLEKRIPHQNQFRFYRLELLPNLFGEWTLHKSWGRIGQRGQTRLQWFKTKQQAIDVFEKTELQKKRNGYSIYPEQLLLF